MDIPPATDLDGDACGDINSGATVSNQLTFTAECDALVDGLFDLPYCTTWDNNAGGVCNTGSQTFPSQTSKCNCDDDYILNNEVVIDKKAPDTLPLPGEQFEYTLLVTNNGPLGASQLTVVDTLPPEVTFVGYQINYLNGPVDNGATCTHNGVNPGGTLTCGASPNYLPNLPVNTDSPAVTPTSPAIEIVVTVELAKYLPDATDVYNNACVTWAGDPTRPEACDDVTITVPVTVALFEAAADGETTTFNWTTSSQTANAGFNLYALVDGERVRLNDELILTEAVDSAAPQDYSISLRNVPGTTFVLEDVAARGTGRMHGPFELAETYGARPEMEPINWTAIRAEQENLAVQRNAAAASAARAKLEASQPTGPLAAVTSWARGALESATGVKPALQNKIAYPTFQLAVDADGLYRLTYEELVAATGVGLAGARADELALTNRYGAPVAITVSGGRSFGPGSYIEFYGEALDTLYTDTNVYTLAVDAALASRVAASSTNVPRNAQAATYYTEAASFEGNNEYSYLSPLANEPWFDTLLLAQKAKSWSFAMPVDNYVPAGGQGILTLQLWGVNEITHRVLAQVNGKQVGDLSFANQDVAELAAPVALNEGANTLVLSVPNDQGAAFDMSVLEAYGLTYPRAFVARDDRLSFAGADDLFTVNNLSSDKVVVYRLENGAWQRLTKIKTAAAGTGYSASFAGSMYTSKYFVATEGALRKPAVSLAASPDGLLGGSADLLIIAHPSFIDGLAPLVAAREAQGFTVRVVDVEQIYAAYSGGVFDADAIKAYIREAINGMGVQYVLLVGGDTYDYRGYTNANSMSFVPSLYAQTTEVVNFAPVDPLYTDLNRDNVPDAAIGRFPVRTLAELELMVGKTLQYDQKGYQSTAVFAADKGFGVYSDDFAGALGANWSVEKAYLAQSSVAVAKAKLIESLNNGVAYASFVGHSGKNGWTFDGLLKVSDVKALTNYGEAALVSQMGCWNTYYVDPTYNTMGHAFLLSGTNGAAAVTGSTTETYMNSEYRLGKLLTPKMVQPGMTVGMAMQTAKADLALSNPDLLDVLLGWTLLGDPTMVVQP